MKTGAAGGLADRYSRGLLAHRAAGLAVALALTVVLGAGAARVRPDFSLEQLFPVGDADRAAYDRYRRAFPGEDARAVVLVTADDVVAPAGLSRLAALEADLRALPGVLRVVGPASLDRVAAGPFGPARERLLPPGLDPAELARRAAAAAADPLLGWNVFTPGGRTVSVLVDLEPATAGSDAGRARFTAAAQALLAHHARPGQALVLSGLPPLRARIAALVAGDVGRLVPLAVLLVIVLLAFAFRSAAAAGAGLVTVLFALLWSYGVLGLLGWPLGILLGVLPIIVVIVSVSDTVHVLGETMAGLEDGAAPRQAIASALAATVGPCLTTELVLAAGFLTLCAIRIQAAIQLGVVTAAAMLVTWLANALVLPLALSALLRRPGARRPAAALLRRAVAWSGRMAEERPGRVLAAAGLVLALAAAAATRVEVRYKVFDDLRPGSPLAREIALAEEAHGGLVPLAVHVLAAGGGEAPALDPEALRAAERAAAFLRGFPEVGQANSLADLVRPLHRALAGDEVEGDGLPEDRLGVAQLLTALDDGGLTADFLSADRTSLAAVGRAVDVGSARVEVLFEELDRWVAAEQARLDARPEGPRLRLEPTGQLRLFRDVNGMLLGGLAMSFGAALLVSLAALSLALRSLRLGAVALVPNVAPVLLVLGFMGLAGIPISPVTVLAFSITLVIADDDTIQLLTRFRRRFAELPEATPSAERHRLAMRAAHQEAGVPMLTSGLAVSVGFALLLLSAFLGPARLGALIAVTLLGAAAADLFVTPVLVNGLLPLRPPLVSPARVTGRAVDLLHEEVHAGERVGGGAGAGGGLGPLQDPGDAHQPQPEDAAGVREARGELGCRLEPGRCHRRAGAHRVAQGGPGIAGGGRGGVHHQVRGGDRLVQVGREEHAVEHALALAAGEGPSARGEIHPLAHVRGGLLECLVVRIVEAHGAAAQRSEQRPCAAHVACSQDRHGLDRVQSSRPLRGWCIRPRLVLASGPGRPYKWGMNSRRVMVVAATLALAACGPSKEEERVAKLKEMCQAAVGGTVLDLENQYGISIRLAECGPGVSTLACAEGPTHCILGFWLPASTDPAVCEPTGCYFACDIRAVQDDLKAHEEDHLATVCGTRWVDGQPAPGPFYYAPFWAPGQLP